MSIYESICLRERPMTADVTVLPPAELPEPISIAPAHDARGFWQRRWPFLATVVLPTALAALYFFGIAADQYESEARFVVRSTQTQLPNGSNGLGQMLGLAGVLNDAQAQSFSVGDYLGSHDAVAALH